MLFQTLDNKEECIGIYYDGNLYFDRELPSGIGGTWSYATFLRDREVRYGYLQCGGKSLDDVCPSHLKEQWETARDKLKAFYRSFHEAKVDLNENCFYDLVPERFLLQFCDIKNKITKHVFENYERPRNYDFLAELSKVLCSIEEQKLNIDLSSLKKQMHEFKTRQACKRISTAAPYIKYDVFGTKTGRLTTRKNSFPILTLSREHRSVLKPKNDWFVEFDFNAAELRVLLALSDREQPQKDIHEWNAKNVYKGLVSRKEAKQRIFAWLYNPESKDHLSEQTYDRNSVVQKYFNGTQVSTFCDRVIPADKHHALNYIIQSTASDLFLDRMVEIHNFLKDKKSFVSFCLHDSLVIDFVESEKHLIPEIKKIFSETKLGNFMVNVSAGKNFGKMERLKI